MFSSGIIPLILSGGTGNDFLSVLLLAVIDVAIIVCVIGGFGVASLFLHRLVIHAMSLALGPQKASIIEGYLTYPGVAFHECSHALFAIISGAKVVGFSLRRVPIEGGYRLGQVKIQPRGNALSAGFQLALSGVAPAITGIIATILLFTVVMPNITEWWQWIIFIYAVICLCLHSELSRADLKATGNGLPIVLLFFLLIFLIFPIDPVAAISTLNGSAASSSSTSKDEIQNVAALCMLGILNFRYTKLLFDKNDNEIETIKTF